MSNASDHLYTTPETSPGPYADAYRALPVKLYQAREAITMHMRGTFQAHDITDPQWRVLRILSTVEEIDLTDLAKRAMLLGPSLSRIMRDLDERGLLKRWTCEKDGRRSLTAITPAGRALIDRVAPEFDPVFALLRAALSGEEIDDLNALLDRVIRSLAG